LSNSDSNDTDGTTEADRDPVQYLGFEYSSTNIDDNKDVQLTVHNIYSNMETLYEYETVLAEAVQNQDANSFFDAYRSYNQTAALIMSQGQGLSDFYLGSDTMIPEDIEPDTSTDDASGQSVPFKNLVQPAYAKERSSWWYYVPVIGSLVKAKHQSIVTARAGIYDYLKNEIDTTDRDRLLHEYDMTSIEDVRTASDSQVEQLARDPELRTGIDWTQVATDLGKQAVLATNEGYKIGASGSPATTTAVNGAIRIFTDKSDPVADTIPPAQERVTLAVPEILMSKVDNTLNDSAGTPWTDMSSDQRDLVTSLINDAGTDITGSVGVFNTGLDSADQISLPAGLYDLLTVSTNSTPVIISDLELTSASTVEVTVDYYDLDRFALDKDIAIQLGFRTPSSTTDLKVTTCSDLGYNVTTEKADTCETAYTSCTQTPYSYNQNYSECISAGGCWDIGRWEYVNESNCPIDANNDLDYTDERLQDDYEYFGSGNRAYCECIVDCRSEHLLERDCADELKTCCSGGE
jgi:hypothetical protein